MKIRHLLIGMLAIAGAVACKQEEPVEEPKLEVNKTNVAIAATAGEGAFEVTANNAWTAAADADWVSLDPASGNGGEKAATVKVTAEDNTATEARTATVTVKAGALTKTLKVTQAAAQGEQPGPGDEPGKDEVAWSMMGCFVDNQWSTDVPMTKEGEWIVAKGAQFTELTFKIRGNGSWDDATNIGRAPGSERAVVNGKIEVVTAEYAKANLGGDAADIKLNGEPGTYDVYFSFENLEVYVMEAGFKPGEKEPLVPQPEPEYTLDGKQWIFTAEESAVLIDLGLFEEGAMVIAVPAMDNGGFACYMYGTYEIEKTDAKSGNIIFTQYDPEWDEFMEPVSYAYSELSESSVNLTMENVIGVAAPIQFNAVPEPYDISFEGLGGGEDPSGAVENGEYWFFNGDKVMAPLAEGVTTGTLPAGNVISGASTEKNIFTLTYDPDYSYYTIQDSYGRYLGQTDETGNITVTDVLPTDETYGLYLWCIEPTYGEAYDIYNAAYYFDLTYSAADNNWVLVDGGYEYPETLPVLVKAENPVEEQPAEPTTEVFWENDGSVPAATWGGSPYRFALDGHDDLNECVATFSADVWSRIKSGPFYVQISYPGDWFQIRILDGWWTNNDSSGNSDINPQSAGLVNNGDGTYTFEVNISEDTALLELIDAQHLLFAGDGFVIEKLYF